MILSEVFVSGDLRVFVLRIASSLELSAYAVVRPCVRIYVLQPIPTLSCLRLVGYIVYIFVRRMSACLVEDLLCRSPPVIEVRAYTVSYARLLSYAKLNTTTQRISELLL